MQWQSPSKAYETVVEIPASQNNHTDPDTDPALACVPASAGALVGIGPLLHSMLWPLEVHPVMPVHWSASAMNETQMRDGGWAGSVERPDTEVPSHGCHNGKIALCYCCGNSGAGVLTEGNIS